MVSGSQCSPGICKPMTIKKEHQEGAVTPHLSDNGPTWADKTWTCICSGESKWSSLTGRMVQARGGWVITWTQSVRRTTIRARSWHLILLAVSYALLIPHSLFYLSYFLPVLKKKKRKKKHTKALKYSLCIFITFFYLEKFSVTLLWWTISGSRVPTGALHPPNRSILHILAIKDPFDNPMKIWTVSLKKKCIYTKHSVTPDEKLLPSQ